MPESVGRREARNLLQAASVGEGQPGNSGSTDVENNLTDSRQEQGVQQREDAQGQGSNSEGRIGTDSQESGAEQILATKYKRQRRYAQKRRKGDYKNVIVR